MYNITLKGSTYKIIPQKVDVVDGETVLICSTQLKDRYVSVSFKCKDITHFENKEILATYIVRPLTRKITELTNDSLRIVVDNLNKVEYMDIISPPKEEQNG